MLRFLLLNNPRNKYGAHRLFALAVSDYAEPVSGNRPQVTEGVFAFGTGLTRPLAVGRYGVGRTLVNIHSCPRNPVNTRGSLSGRANNNVHFFNGCQLLRCALDAGNIKPA